MCGFNKKWFWTNEISFNEAGISLIWLQAVQKWNQCEILPKELLLQKFVETNESDQIFKAHSSASSFFSIEHKNEISNKCNLNNQNKTLNQ